jgi:NADPH:quinone reductase-like Zn-dependent oxidoreductase
VKAIFYHEHGSTERLQYGELPDPEPEPGEVLVRLEAVSLNHMDLFTLEGWPGLQLEMPHIPGADGAGEIVAVDPGATEFAIGDRVVVYPNLTCGMCEYCLSGADNLCRQWQLLGEHAPGTFRQLIALPERNLLKMPSNFDAAVAAAAALVFLTAWHSLITRGELRRGEHVLVIGASGGVNTASIQVAKYAGAVVYVLGSSPEKLSVAQRLGADVLIDRQENPAWYETAYLADGRRGVDVVVDNVGAPTMEQSMRAARKGGRILTVGNTGGPRYEIDNRLVFGKHLSILGSTMGTRSEFETVMGLVFRGKLSPLLDRRYALKEATAAFTRMQAGDQLGKITLTVAP